MSDQSYFQELAKAGSGKPQSKVGRLEGMGMSERGVYEELVKFGIPKLDAGIITDCLNMEKACMWQNDEDGLQRGRSASSLQNFENRSSLREARGIEQTKPAKYVSEGYGIRVKRFSNELILPFALPAKISALLTSSALLSLYPQYFSMQRKSPAPRLLQWFPFQALLLLSKQDGNHYPLSLRQSC